MQTKPYEFMVKYTPHTRWAEGSGALIAVAFFLGSISGGLYLMSLYFNSIWGMFIGWLMALLVGMVDMAHLHKPLRFWRMLLRPNTSWIARGFIFIALFIGFAAIQLILSYWFPGAVENVFKVFSGMCAFGVVVYSGFVLSYVKAIRLWNSAMTPLIFVISGLVGGTAILLMISLGDGAVQVDTLQFVLRVMLVAYAIMVVMHLWISTYSSSAARNSAMWILKGNIASIFWAAIVLVGIIIPLFIFFLSSSESTALLIIGAIFVIIGNLALRYILLKGGLYSPLTSSYDAV